MSYFNFREFFSKPSNLLIIQIAQISSEFTQNYYIGEKSFLQNLLLPNNILPHDISKEKQTFQNR